MKTVLTRPAVLWFLFAFNALVALLALLAVDGTRGVVTAIGMGVVSLGAGATLLTRRRRPLSA